MYIKVILFHLPLPAVIILNNQVFLPINSLLVGIPELLGGAFILFGFTFGLLLQLFDGVLKPPFVGFHLVHIGGGVVGELADVHLVGVEVLIPVIFRYVKTQLHNTVVGVAVEIDGEIYRVVGCHCI